MQAILLFGGLTYTTIFDDTWEFSKATGWKQLKPSVSPPALAGAAMAYDPTTKTVVLFGGNMSNASSDETWTWDGVTWTRQFPPVSPSAREFNGNGMVFDSAIGKVVLFGGDQYGPTNFMNDTWEWDGQSKTWTEKFPADSPSPRQATLGYDEISKQVLLFGGFTQGYVYYGDTWTYDGFDWTQQQPTTLPPPRCDNALVFDPSLKSVVLFGGLAGPCESCDEGRLNDTWLWGGTNWTQAQPPASPSPRSGMSFDYDETMKGMLLFGGWISPAQFTDTNWFLGVR
jgi:hypothetical protein